jgi:hypothetical protein
MPMKFCPCYAVYVVPFSLRTNNCHSVSSQRENQDPKRAHQVAEFHGTFYNFHCRTISLVEKMNLVSIVLLLHFQLTEIKCVH